MDMDNESVPMGFELLHNHCPFQNAFGQLYLKRTPQGAVVGLRVAQRHLNRHAILHGGALATFLDVAMGYSILLQPAAPPANVTVSLSIDFIEPGRHGDWLEADVVVGKIGKRLAFARCEVHSGARLIARGSGVWACKRTANR